MKRIVVASDSFKGTLSSMDICSLFNEAFKDKKDYIVHSLPLADGGEGSLEAIATCIKGRYVEVEVTSLYRCPMKVFLYIDNDNNAYIETASCAGFNLKKDNSDPGQVTTYGLGEQIRKAIELGCKNIYMFLGGSATNDGGCGLASALGTVFYDKKGNPFIPTGYSLIDIAKIDNSRVKEQLKGINIVALSDVKSPFFGPEGAAYKFGPQKGATKEGVVLLDEGLRHLSKVIQKDLGLDISSLAGSGAAGGLGGGLVAFAKAKIVSGIDAILDLIHFDEVIQNADLIISGEGKLDKQTLDGKVIDGVAKRCKKYKKPLSIIVGINTIDEKLVKEKYLCLKDIYETNDKHLPFEEIIKSAKEDYLRKINELIMKEEQDHD